MLFEDILFQINFVSACVIYFNKIGLGFKRLYKTPGKIWTFWFLGLINEDYTLNINRIFSRL